MSEISSKRLVIYDNVEDIIHSITGSPNKLCTALYKCKWSDKGITTITIRGNQYIAKRHQVEDFSAINLNEVPHLIPQHLQKILSSRTKLPEVLIPCLYQGEQFSYKINNGTGDVVEVKGPLYMCVDNMVTEYLITLLTATLYKQNICVNFIDVYDLAVCPNGGKLSDYLVIEKINGYSIKNAMQCYQMGLDELFIGFYIQILFSVLVLNEKLGIVHGDLHNENILIYRPSHRDTYNGKKLYNADYYKYTFGNTSIYFKSYGFIVKIIDYGMATKWSDSKVLNKTIIMDEIDGYIPNWYMPAYDTLLLSKKFATAFGKTSKFFRKVSKMLPPDRSFTVKYGKRPNIKKLAKKYYKLTANFLLSNKDLFHKYYKKPSSGKIVELGNI